MHTVKKSCIRREYGHLQGPYRELTVIVQGLRRFYEGTILYGRCSLNRSKFWPINNYGELTGSIHEAYIESTGYTSRVQ